MMMMMMMMTECTLYGAGNVFLSMICIHPLKENKTLECKKEKRILKEFLKEDTCVNNSTMKSWAEFDV
jgi:predicted tellurium resistance membrane protein TerC